MMENNRPLWRNILDNTLELEQLQRLISDLGADIENLAGNTRVGKIESLLRHLKHTDNFGRLIQLVLNKPEWISVKRAYLSLEFSERRQALDIESSDSPYRGLEVFEEEHAPLFFGRESLIGDLAEKISLIATQQETPNFLAILGASGSGKSSLVRAGIVPKLKEMGWFVLLTTPTIDPLESLARSLDDGTQSKLAILKMQDELLADKRIFHAYLSDIAERSKPKLNQVVLVLDQFEELFTLCDDDTKRRKFVENLLYALDLQRQNKLFVLLTLRADFYHRVAWSEGLRRLLERQQEYIGQMDHSELVKVIAGPAALGDYELEEGLVERIVADVGHDPGNLPLLSHALLKTWEYREGATGKLLTLAGYERSGGVRRAITQTADSIFNQLENDEKSIVRNIFTRLTKLGDGAEDTRRHVYLDELIPMASDREKVLSVLARLVHSRLITMDRDTTQAKVYVSHEVLIREWRMLRKWLTDDRDGLRILDALKEGSGIWDKNGRKTADLYSGTRLSQALGWVEDRVSPLSHVESSFLQASKNEKDRLEQEAEAEIQRKIDLANNAAKEEKERREQAQRLAESAEARQVAEMQSRLQAELLVKEAEAREAVEIELRMQAERSAAQQKKQRNRAFRLASFAALLASVAIWFFLQADGLAATTQAQAVLSLATAQLPLDPTVAELETARLIGIQGVKLNEALSTEWFAQSVDPTFVYSQMLSLYNLPKDKQLLGHTDTVLSVAFSPDGEYLATAGHDQTIHLWDLQDRTKPPTILEGHRQSVNALVFTPDSRKLISAGSDRTIHIWDLGNLQTAPIVLEGHQDDIQALDISPDGKIIVSASSDETVRLWRLDRLDAAPEILLGHTGRVLAVAISPDGKMIASGGSDDRIHLWAIHDPSAPIRVLDGHRDQINGIAFSPDGSMLASASYDQTVRLWSLSGGVSERSVLHGHTAPVTAVSFSPDGQTMATADRDSSIRLWPITDNVPQNPQILRGQSGGIEAVAFSLDGLILASGGRDHTVRLWKLGTQSVAPTVYSDHSGAVTSFATSMDGQWLASTSSDDTVRLWDWQQPSNEPTQFYAETEITSVAFTPDRTYLVGGGMNGIVYLWDLLDPMTPPTELVAHEDTVWAVAVSPDGQTVASASSDETIRIWQIQNPQVQPTVFAGHTGNVLSVAYAPDGRMLASASADHTIRLWDLQNSLSDPTVLAEHQHWVTSVAFSSDGQTLASADLSQAILLWDMATLRSPSLLSQAEEWSIAGQVVAFSPDNQTLVSGGVDGVIRLWDWHENQAPPTLLQGHSGAASGVQFSPDGQYIISSGEDSSIRLWPTLDRLVDMSCQQVQRNLTVDEWANYMANLSYERTCFE